MEFLKQNYINTTTQISVNTNSSTASNLFNTDQFYQFYSDGLNNDLTTTTITIAFTETTLISRIGLMDTNAKEFRLFYNGLTANAFALTSTGSTTTSAWTGNSESNIYLRCTPTYVTSVTLDIKKTQTADQEKRLGTFVLSDLYYSMAKIPNSKGYDPRINPKQVVHTLSDGGTRIHNVRKKWSADLKLDYIDTTQKTNLKTIYDLQSAFIFCPFGTTTSWDGVLFEAVWTGGFDFYQYSDDASSSGFSGAIRLKETPS